RQTFQPAGSHLDVTLRTAVNNCSALLHCSGASLPRSSTHQYTALSAPFPAIGDNAGSCRTSMDIWDRGTPTTVPDITPFTSRLRPAYPTQWVAIRQLDSG